MGRKVLLVVVLLCLTVPAFLGACGSSGGAQRGQQGTSDAGQTTSAAAKTQATTTSSEAAAAGSPPVLPDASLHPGATNPDVTQENISSTICKSGFTKTIRPPASYTDKLERQQISEGGLPGTPQDYEEDHLISLELGGAPKDEKNLWPEPYENRGAKFAQPGTGSETKDKVENETKRQVCSGKMTLADAQQRIASDWRKLGKDEGMS